MRYSFIFCLLAMYYTASASATSCLMEMDIPSVPCLKFCHDSIGGDKLIPKVTGAPCQRPGGNPGICKDGLCEKPNQ
uniref:Putative salivary secreted protein n=1 Tax=Ixodes ricinus TaxID=34613 RepID=A0A090X884_IXORI